MDSSQLACLAVLRVAHGDRFQLLSSPSHIHRLIARLIFDRQKVNSCQTVLACLKSVWRGEDGPSTFLEAYTTFLSSIESADDLVSLVDFAHSLTLVSSTDADNDSSESGNEDADQLAIIEPESTIGRLIRYCHAAFVCMSFDHVLELLLSFQLYILGQPSKHRLVKQAPMIESKIDCAALYSSHSNSIKRGEVVEAFDCLCRFFDYAIMSSDILVDSAASGYFQQALLHLGTAHACFRNISDSRQLLRDAIAFARKHQDSSTLEIATAWLNGYDIDSISRIDSIDIELIRTQDIYAALSCLHTFERASFATDKRAHLYGASATAYSKNGYSMVASLYRRIRIGLYSVVLSEDAMEKSCMEEVMLSIRLKDYRKAQEFAELACSKPAASNLVEAYIALDACESARYCFLKQQGLLAKLDSLTQLEMEIKCCLIDGKLIQALQLIRIYQTKAGSQCPLPSMFFAEISMKSGDIAGSKKHLQRAKYLAIKNNQSELLHQLRLTCICDPAKSEGIRI